MHFSKKSQVNILRKDPIRANREITGLSTTALRVHTWEGR